MDMRYTVRKGASSCATARSRSSLATRVQADSAAGAVSLASAREMAWLAAGPTSSSRCRLRESKKRFLRMTESQARTSLCGASRCQERIARSSVSCTRSCASCGQRQSRSANRWRSGPRCRATLAIPDSGGAIHSLATSNGVFTSR